MGNGANIELKFNRGADEIIKKSGVNTGTLIFAAKEARDMMREYVPMKTGALANTAIAFAERGRGVVLYIQPYAEYCYHGNNKTFSRDKHEKASAYWDIAMILANRGALTGRVEEFIKNKM